MTSRPTLWARVGFAVSGGWGLAPILGSSLTQLPSGTRRHMAEIDLADSAVTADDGLRFCTRCGAARHVGPCAAAARRRTGSLRARRPAARAVGAVGVVLLVVAVIAAGFSVMAARQDARRASARAQRSATQLWALQRRVASTESAAGSMSVRIGSLEAKAASQPDPTALAKRVAPSVFTIDAGDSLGSGFVMRTVDGRSSLVTNFHVVADTWNGGQRHVKVRQEDRTFDGTIVKADQADDLAVIEVTITLPALARATEHPVVGDPVLVVGSPLGLGGTVSSGIVSALRTEAGQTYVQFSAPISPGNSGGPVVDRNGRVIGVSEMKEIGDGAEGLSFAIPIDRVCSGVAVC